jgi:hypothetical protein
VFDLKVTRGQSDLTRLAKALRKEGDAKEIRKQLTKGLRDGTKPAVAKVKSEALSLPAKGESPNHLRRKMAKATGTQVRTGGRDAGVKVRVSRARMGNQAALARVTNKGPWRHPVYQRRGAKPVWVTQRSKAGWFDNANRSTSRVVRREIKNVMDGIEKRLSHT